MSYAGPIDSPDRPAHYGYNIGRRSLATYLHVLLKRPLYNSRDRRCLSSSWLHVYKPLVVCLQCAHEFDLYMIASIDRSTYRVARKSSNQLVQRSSSFLTVLSPVCGIHIAHEILQLHLKGPHVITNCLEANQFRAGLSQHWIGYGLDLLTTCGHQWRAPGFPPTERYTLIVHRKIIIHTHKQKH